MEWVSTFWKVNSVSWGTNWLRHRFTRGMGISWLQLEMLCMMKCSKTVWVWNPGTRFSDNMMVVGEQLALMTLEIFSNLNNPNLLWFYVVALSCIKTFLAVVPGVVAETLWCSESYHNLSYHLCSFATTQEVKGAWTPMPAAVFFAIGQICRVQFDASLEQLRLSVVGSDYIVWNEKEKKCFNCMLWS